MIKISGLKKKYGDFYALQGIDLQVEEGTIYGLVGLSGAGKSTLLRCINGLVSYDEGSLKVDGVEINSLGKRELLKFRKNIGMIFQNFSLLERLTVYDNIAFPMRIWKKDLQEIDFSVKKMAKLVGLEDKLRSRPRELSGGQKQRVAIARALVMNPKLLLCDEATSALDPRTGSSILELLKKINIEFGITIILVTHQINAVEQICDKMALLENGVKLIDGNVEELFLQNPPSLKKLVGEKQILDEGVFFRILIPKSKGYEQIFCELYTQSNVKFEFVSGGIREFKGKEVFLGTIKVNEEDAKNVSMYLDKKQIRYEVETHGE